MNRRGFLKRLGGAGLALVAAPLILPSVPALARPVPAAPLYIPSDRLDFGVPSEIVRAPEITHAATQKAIGQAVQRTETIRQTRMGNVPVTLRQSEFMAEWGGKFPSGSTLYVDEVTAVRWTRNRVAVPESGWLMSQSIAVQREFVRQVVTDA